MWSTRGVGGMRGPPTNRWVRGEGGVMAGGWRNRGHGARWTPSSSNSWRNRDRGHGAESGRGSDRWNSHKPSDDAQYDHSAGDSDETSN